MRFVHASLAFTLATGIALAQASAPSIQEGPINAASYSPPALPNGALAPGSMFIIKGANLGACGTTIAQSFPLQRAMSDTQIHITVDGRTHLAYMIYVVTCRQDGPDQIAAILPSDTALGTGSVVVEVGGRVSNLVPIRIISSSFGMFTRNQAGSGPAIVQNFISQSSQPTNGLVESAQPGQVAILWGTGLGAAMGNEVAGPAPGDLGTPIEVFVGGMKAEVTYRGRSGCCAGIDQIVFTIPRGVEGCYVSIAVRAAGVVSNVGTISISPTGKFCLERSGLGARELTKVSEGNGLTIGAVSLNRIRMSLSVPGVGNIQSMIDDAGGKFVRFRTAADVMASNSLLAGLTAMPSAGSCILASFPFSGENALDAAIPDVKDFSVRESLDAGAALNLLGPLGNKQIPRTSDGGTGFEYLLPKGTYLGGGIALPGFPPLIPPYLNPGVFIVNNDTGSPTLSTFVSGIMIPLTTLNWINQREINNVPRSQPLTINWTGGVSGTQVHIVGASSDVASKVGVLFYCSANADDRTFTVPEWVLSALPASQSLAGLPVGFIHLDSNLALPSRFAATGLDIGTLSVNQVLLKNVSFQ